MEGVTQKFIKRIPIRISSMSVSALRTVVWTFSLKTNVLNLTSDIICRCKLFRTGLSVLVDIEQLALINKRIKLVSPTLACILVADLLTFMFSGGSSSFERLNARQFLVWITLDTVASYRLQFLERIWGICVRRRSHSGTTGWIRTVIGTVSIADLRVVSKRHPAETC